MDDLLATIRITNNLLAKKLNGRTLTSVCACAEVEPGAISAYRTFKRSPYKKDGQLRNSVKKFLWAIDASVEEIFPARLYEKKFPTKMEKTYSSELLLPLWTAKQLTTNPIDLIDPAEKEKAIDNLFLTLTPREEKVLRMRYWEGKTIEEIGDHFTTSRARASQIATKAIRKLKHPAHRHLVEKLF